MNKRTLATTLALIAALTLTGCGAADQPARKAVHMPLKDTSISQTIEDTAQVAVDAITKEQAKNIAKTLTDVANLAAEIIENEVGK